MANPGGMRSMAWRVALAAALMFGFYGLAVGMVAALVGLPIVVGSYVKAGAIVKLALFCGVGAFLILRSILPRRDRFEVPGPVLDADGHPRLFTELGRIAAATAQPMPAEVYLLPDVNAWVAHRGGVMGFGSREVMGIGLPLLQALRVDELRAVLAHEFGHYVGGDVKLGPWVYKTRQALVRTVESLAGHSGLMMKPFDWYAALFFRVSHAVSRQQELQADALAARIAGPAAMAGGLRETHRATLGFNAYWSELMPVLGAGFLPPVAGGFARFMEQPRVVSGLRDALDQEMREGKQDPYDTHPCLRDRLAALPAAAPEAAPESALPALTLLDDVPGMERRLVMHLARKGGPERLDPVAWEEVPAAVHLPAWKAFVARHGNVFAGVTAAGLASLDWKAVANKLARTVDGEGDAASLADYAVAAAISVALTGRGFALATPPGAPPVVVRDGLRLEPFALRASLAEEGGAERWRVFCNDAGIADVDLGALVPPAGARS